MLDDLFELIKANEYVQGLLKRWKSKKHIKENMQEHHISSHNGPINQI